jgi:hypothetical protein
VIHNTITTQAYTFLLRADITKPNYPQTKLIVCKYTQTCTPLLPNTQLALVGDRRFPWLATAAICGSVWLSAQWLCAASAAHSTALPCLPAAAGQCRVVWRIRLNELRPKIRGPVYYQVFCANISLTTNYGSLCMLQLTDVEIYVPKHAVFLSSAAFHAQRRCHSRGVSLRFGVCRPTHAPRRCVYRFVLACSDFVPVTCSKFPIHLSY